MKLSTVTVIGIMSLGIGACATNGADEGADGTTQSAITSTPIAKGRLVLDADMELSKGPHDFVVAKVAMLPGDVIPWHFHPGPLTVLVTAGTFTLHHPDGSTQIYPTGTGFVEPACDVHFGSNDTAGATEFHLTAYLPPGAPLRTYVTAPNPYGDWMNAACAEGLENVNQ